MCASGSVQAVAATIGGMFRSSIVFVTVLAMLPAPLAVASTAAAQALRIARESQPEWQLGPMRAERHHGRLRVRAEIVAGGRAVARLRIDPSTGTLVGKRDRPATADVADVGRLRPDVERHVARLVVGPTAWPIKHRGVWRVAVFSGSRLVATVKVDVPAGRLVAHDADDDHDDDDHDDEERKSR
jgi:hypothetical protein